MTDQIILKRKGGRPRLPDPPANSSECLRLISVETVRTNPSVRKLQQLKSLNRLFVAAEKCLRQDAENQALIEQNRLAAQTNALQKAEYLRRMSLGPLGARMLVKQIETLKARVSELETELAEKRTTDRSVVDCGVMQEQKINSGLVPTLEGSGVYAE